MKFISWDKDNNLFVALLLVTIGLVYFSPSVIITRIVFLLFIPIIFFSKKDFFWLAWIFILMDAPGLLFRGGQLDDPNRIPLYTMIPGISIHFFELVILTFILKIVIKKKKRSIFLFMTEAKIFIGLIAFYLLYSIVVFDLMVVILIKSLIPWAYVFICYHLLNDENKFNDFNKLIFPIVIFVFSAQIFSFISGKHLVNLFKLEIFQTKAHLSKEIGITTTEVSRTLYCMFLIFYIIIIVFNYLYRKKSPFNRLYLFIILGFAYISSLLSATRGFFIAVNFIFVCALVISVVHRKKVGSLFGSIAAVAGLVFALTVLSPVASRQIELSTKRYSTLVLLAEGDITAGGTLGRLDKTMPRIMKIVNKSPILGYGFSSVFYKEGNGDVGFAMNLLNTGYVGTILLYAIFLSVVFKIYKYSRNKIYQAVYQISGHFIYFGLLAVLIFHLTTNCAFGLTPGLWGGQHERYLIYALLLSFFNVTINALRNNSTAIKPGLTANMNR